MFRSATYSYDTNGNLTTILEPGSLRTTMAYDKENRMISNTDHDPGADPSDVTTVFTYDGDGLKQTEFEDLFGTTTTLVWDGMNVIQELP